MASPTLLGLLPPLNSPPGPNLNNNNNHQSVRKCGYLRKQKHGHKRFFVLRGPGGSGEEPPAAGGARLEYYENEKKWKNKSGAPKRVIALDSCLNINKRADAKHKYLIALYTKDEYFAVAAENEQEQEGWYRALTDLLNEGKAACQGSPLRHLSSPFSSCSAAGSSLAGGCEDLNYGLLAPASAVYREVWQVTLKPKGLGQSKNLTGVHRLCLSARTIGFVRLNCELPSVTLQLMNIRRCGHSDSFFFMEVGRSAATGPGELWMQADDSVVAQNIHETILGAMKALKELSEFRPRSKSQSSSSSSSGGAGGPGASSTHPITVPGRRHHHLVNLPPSQTGLLRRSRTDSLAAGAGAGAGASAGSKGNPGRVRTASEGDGCRAGSVAGSPMSPGPVRTPLSRSHTLSSGGKSGGRLGPVPPGGGLQNSRSMSMPVSHSPPSATSPISLSSSSGLGSEPPHPQRLSSGSASVSGSPSDPGFMSFDEYGSSPGGDLRPFSTASNRSNTPESIAETPPVRDPGGGADLYGYMAMERPQSGRLCYRPCPASAGDKGPRKRTYSLTTPCRQRAAPPQVSSASLDEYTLMRATLAGSSGRLFPAASPKVTYAPYPEDYGDVEIGSHRSSGGGPNLGPPAGGGGGGGDDGYMPMSPGVAAALGPGSRGGADYMPMSPTSVSAPQQILRPRAGAGGGGSPGNGSGGYKSGESSPDDSGYMRMWGGSRLSVESSDGRLSGGDYINMSPHGPPAASLTPPDFFFAPAAGAGDPPKAAYACSSLPRACPPQQPAKDSDQYVFMSCPGGLVPEQPACGGRPAAPSSHTVPSPLRHGRTESFLSPRALRPSRLALAALRTLLPSTHEHPLPPEPQSPGEYINIDFGEPAAADSPPSLPADSPASSLGSGAGRRRSPLSDYMNIDLGSRAGPVPGGSPESCASRGRPAGLYLQAAVGAACRPSPPDGGDYTDMAFGLAATPPQPIGQKPESARLTSPTAGVKRLPLAGVEAFILSSPPPDPNRGAKVIRADPQGRRRHSSETFSSTTTVTPVSPSFAHNPKRHNSASVENVSLRKSEGLEEEQGSSPMCRETSAGFQNGLNYIAIDVVDGSLANCDRGRRKGRRAMNGDIGGVETSAYASIDFLSHNLKETSAVKVTDVALVCSAWNSDSFHCPSRYFLC
ncbi:insulin receptor substrate 2 isoform X1 [Dermochelys coriacea]|uniref:insulin receptor substrate 2 isoform X1 n=1 Tax=Dermochelys coriacea TaxID=27794 RepID=UPI001CA80C35|nr:insulin receptor substrate 2 isoform X1 [Dermochelys coriacea]